jgi:LPS-assembly protein
LPPFARHGRTAVLRSCVLGLAASGVLSAFAQAPASPVPPTQVPGLGLRISPLLKEKLSETEKSDTPLFVRGQDMRARTDLDMVVEGEAELRRPGLSIRADRVDFQQTSNELEATGHVRISRDISRFEGPHLKLQLDSFRGQFDQPTFELYTSGGYGQAERVEFLDDSRAVVHQARYTTCRRTPGPEWLPEWLLKAAQMSIDEEESTVRAKDVQLRFQDLPVITVPSISFGMSDERKSGFLPPLMGIDTINGIEVSQPYYWNIAPQRDATVTTRAMSKRGVEADTEFRYLESDYSGQARVNLMPADKLRNADRWAVSVQHKGSVDTGLSSVGPLAVNLNINRVSDDNYWRDFPRAGLVLTQRLLPSTGGLYWGSGNLSMSAQVQRWQTLQVPGSPITPPYDRAPQLTLRYGQWNVQGLDWSVIGDTTRFEADFSRLGNGLQARNGERSYMQAQVSHPWVRPWGFFTPKVQLHATRYQLDRPLDNGSTSMDRVLPTFSLDSGLVFERETQWFGRGVVQTLEPRAFYARTPMRDQSLLPVYDTGATDFNLSTIYSENPYVGQDRIVDNDAITLGVTSRLFDAKSGAEMLRLGMAQRIRFSSQQVVLPGQLAAGAGLSDLLLGAGVRWDDRWTFDSTVQVNPQTHDVMRTTLQTRYNPGPYRVFNIAYRLNRAVSEQVDVGWQWPLSDLRWGGDSTRDVYSAPGQGLGADRWYGVGRLNFSLSERRMVDALVGLEYDAGCWLGRVVFERLQNTVSTANTRLMFQLEFVGLARVGSSPLKSLRNNIPRYQYLRDDTVQPSRFLHYE